LTSSYNSTFLDLTGDVIMQIQMLSYMLLTVKIRRGLASLNKNY